jgi:hypothetical protein
MFKSWLLYWAKRRDRMESEADIDTSPRNREKRRRNWRTHKRGRRDEWERRK